MKYARITYTAHARVRMAERSISEQVVADVLADPDQTYTDQGNLVAERVLAGGKPWRVVYAEERRQSEWTARVVSVYRIDRLKKR